MDLIEQIVEIYDNYDYTTEVLVASVRGPQHIVEAAAHGRRRLHVPGQGDRADVPPPAHRRRLERFLKDREKAQAAAAKA